MKLLSVHLPSNRPFFFRRLVTSLAERAVDRSRLDIVVKIDDADTAMHKEVEAVRRDLGVDITALVSPRPRDYYDLSRFCNDAFAHSDPEAYFCWHVNDEVVVETQNWDELLARYVGFFPDHLFRLKISPDKMLRNFLDIHEVNLYGDFPITTRRWLELTEGWVKGHGAEPYQEAVAFMLVERGIHRSIPLPDFRVAGDEPGQNIAAETVHLRNERMCYHWDQNMAPGLREQMARCARRIELSVTAGKMGLVDYRLEEFTSGKYISLIAADGAVMSRLWYAVDPLAIHLANLRDVARRNEQVWPHSLWGKPGWYKALVRLWRLGERLRTILFFTVYAPVAALFGAPVRCWIAAALEPLVVRHWSSLMRVKDGMKKWAPFLVPFLKRLCGGLRNNGWLS